MATCEELIEIHTEELKNKTEELDRSKGKRKTFDYLRQFGFCYGAIPVSYLTSAYQAAARRFCSPFPTEIVYDDAPSCGVVPTKYALPPTITDWVPSSLSEVPSLDSSVSIRGAGVVRGHGVSLQPGEFLMHGGAVNIPVMLIYTYGAPPTIAASTYSKNFSIGSSMDCSSIPYSNALYADNVAAPSFGGSITIGNFIKQIS